MLFLGHAVPADNCTSTPESESGSEPGSGSELTNGIGCICTCSRNKQYALAEGGCELTSLRPYTTTVQSLDCSCYPFLPEG